MIARQKIFRVRRNYNQWVNNQTLEDYALRFTAKSARKWSLGRVANTALGAISFLALEAIGGAITLSYGFDNAALAILVVSLVIFFAGLPICYYAAKYGVDIDLLTRGAGFGYIGSTITSLIYASFTFIFFALEAAIMAMALKLMLGIPLSIGYIICSIMVIPLVTHGITFISRFQLWTQPIWVLLQILPFCFILYHDMTSITDWTSFTGINQPPNNSISLIYFGAAVSVLFSLVAQIGEQVDFLRFLPVKTKENNFRWWSALICAGPGWIVIGALKMFAGSFLAVLAIKNGVDVHDASDPAQMYIIAFNYVTHSPEIALIIGGLFVILSQLKINVTNAYAGSIAWSNFFSRLTHNHPGRVVWLVFNVCIALMLMELGIYAIIAVAWVATLVADLVVNKPLGLSPRHIEFKRSYLYDINPVGVGAMILSTLIGALCYLNTFGSNAQSLAHFITILVALVSVPLLAYVTKGEFYIARESSNNELNQSSYQECVTCQNKYEIEDMAMCPAYNGGICSLCCSLDVRCHDACKEVPSFMQRISLRVSDLLPNSLGNSFNHYFTQFAFLLLVITIIIGSLLGLIYINVVSNDQTINSILSDTLWKAFFILTIVAGVVAWLLVLANKSRKVAEEESQNQNQLLKEEISAHKQTDAALQTAREYADAANSAKSRYVSGISHELRTPLNSILGYAQLLEKNSGIPEKSRNQLSVIRSSGEHLADLIEGLLDISKIEAGRLVLYRDKINLHRLMRQIESMFQIQAESKNLVFIYTPPTTNRESGRANSQYPEYVFGDEKRLRQILINLLSNAIKFTDSGKVHLSLSYRNEVAKFHIDDTGRGIPKEEIDRLFKPFERIRQSDTAHIPGTGLGLTITKLLVDIMGGDLQLHNNKFCGLSALVSLMLPSTVNTEVVTPQKLISGYKGVRRSIVTVDDNPNHRALIFDFLRPLGFNVLEAHDSESCLELFKKHQPDLTLLDISLPEINGWQLAEELRSINYKNPILMVSASGDEHIYTNLNEKQINDYLVKPIKLEELLSKLSQHLNLTWNYETELSNKAKSNHSMKNNLNNSPTKDVLQRLSEHINIGHLTGFNDELKRFEIEDKKQPDELSCKEFIAYMRQLSRNVELNEIKNVLNDLLTNTTEEFE